MYDKHCRRKKDMINELLEHNNKVTINNGFAS